MTDHLKEQRAVEALTNVRHYNADVLADAFRERDLRLAIVGAVEMDDPTHTFKKDDVQELADHFGIEYDRFTSGVDLRRQICTHCNCDYDEFASDTFTKPQLAAIARRLAKDGDFETEWQEPTDDESGSRWWLPSRQAVSTTLGVTLSLVISLHAINLLTNSLSPKAVQFPNINVTGLLASFLVMLIALVVMVWFAMTGPRRSYQI